MNFAKGSKTNTIKAVTVFSLCLLGFDALLTGLFGIFWEILWDYFYGDFDCQDFTARCLVAFGVLLLFVSFASYCYGIILGLGIIRWILRIEGNYLGTFAYGLIGAIPTLFLPITYFSLFFSTGSYWLPFGIAFAFALIVAAASGIGYVKEGRGVLNWVRVLGVVSGAFFLIIGIAFLFVSILGYQTL